MVHDKDLWQLRGQRIFLQMSSKYQELPSIHAQLKHFHQAVEHSQVRVNTFFELDFRAAKWIDANFRPKDFVFG